MQTVCVYTSINTYGLEKKNNVGKKIVNFWLDKLKKNPELYDKIEFDISITCFSFDKENKYRNNFPKNLNKKNFIEFFDLLKSLTIDLISKKNTHI